MKYNLYIKEMLKLGVHVALSSKVLDNKKPAKSLSKAILRDLDSLGLNAAQIFTFGPHSLNENKIDYQELISDTKDIDLSIHGPYMTPFVWKMNPSKPNKFNLDKINEMFLSCKKARAWGMVIHVTKHPPNVIAAAVSNLLIPIAKKHGVKIILEMVANKADDKTYETPDKINMVTRMIGKNKHWCWCIDTAHLWGAGVDIRSKDAMDAWFDGIQHKDTIKMIHLNGSSSRRGSGDDKHEIIFSAEDLIYHGIPFDKSGVKSVLEFAKKNSLVIICEINRGKHKDVFDAIKLLKINY